VKWDGNQNFMKIKKNCEILKIYDKKTFSREISDLLFKNPEETCMDIIFSHAEKLGIEHDMIPDLLSPRLKDLLYKEALKRNFFTKKTKPLEIIEDSDEGE
jgi:hypothetical protein